MDPDEALRRCRQLAAETAAMVDYSSKLRTQASESRIIERANELADTFQGLDQWLTRGGFLPQPWRR